MSDNKLAIRQPAPLTFTPAQVDVLKRVVARGASDDEFKMFLAVSERRGLDPFKGQIHLIPFWDAEAQKMGRQPVTGIHGLMAVAFRTGLYRGRTDYEWTADGEEWVKVWLSDRPPVAARVGVYVKDYPNPVVSVAVYTACVKTKKDGSPNATWAKLPARMLAKCALAEALREALPEEVGGLYIAEEFGGASPDTPEGVWTAADGQEMGIPSSATPNETPRPTEAERGIVKDRLTGKQQKRMMTLFKEAGFIKHDAYIRYANDVLNANEYLPVGSTTELTGPQAALIIASLEKIVTPLDPTDGDEDFLKQ